MDENLNLVVQWFTRLGVLNLNLNKLKRQLSVIDNWFKCNCRAAFLAVTGFGKTYVAIITIFRLNLKYKDASIIVIVPTINLKQDWEKHIYNFELKNVQVYVANGYANEYLEKRKIIRGYKHACTLLILDEIHNYISDTGILLNQVIDATQCDMLLGLSATLDEREIQILDSFSVPICDEVTMTEAHKFQYISDYTIYNYGIKLDGVDRENYDRVNDIHNSNFAKFRWFPEAEKNYELARACCAGNDTIMKVGDEYKTGRSWRIWYSEKQEWDGKDDDAYWSIKSINKYAQQWNWAMRERKHIINNHVSKLIVAQKIIEYLNVRTITFTENTEFADKLTLALGDKARSYHSNLTSNIEITEVKVVRKSYTAAKNLKLRMRGTLNTDNSTGKPIYTVTYNKETKVSQKKVLSKIKQEFIDNKYLVLNTARAFNEGSDVPDVECGIICAATSVRRATVQRMGRILRYIEGKKAKLFNLYLIDTQDESWLKRRQKGDTNIKWITSLKEIKL